MSVNIYARQAPLSDAVGRADYISSSNRQEHLLATASTVPTPDYWQHLAADCQTAFRQAGGSKTKEDGTELKACEAREIHVQLPNSALQKMTADQLAQKLANDFKSKYGVDCLVGVHYNKTESNLHFHIMFSERQLLEEPEVKIADRNVFLDENGIRKRTKKEILDADGQLLPGCSIVKKGEILSARYFGDKNTMFSEKAWMDEYRRDMAEWINTNLEPDELRTVYNPNGPYLAQKHVGKAPDKQKDLKEWNKYAREFNRLLKEGYITEDEGHDFKTRILLSPDQNQELKAVIAELHREIKPDNPHRAEQDLRAAAAATAPLSPGVENRQAKQELRELYKAHAKARMEAIEAPDDVQHSTKKAEISALDKKIERKKEQLGVTQEQKRLREIGRLAGVKKEDVDRICREAPRMTSQQWREIWNSCRSAQSDFWDRYRARQEDLQKEISAAYKRRRRVRNAEWLIDPRNRNKSLLGILYAGIVLAKNGCLERMDYEIDRLKDEQTALRREVQRFKAATSDTRETLNTRGLDPEKYLASVKQLQKMAEQIQEQQSRSFTQQRGPSRTRELSR